MKLTYNPETNAAYLRFKEEEKVQVETHILSDSVWVDIAPDGTIVGIELLNANAQLKAGHDGNFVFSDLVSGREEMLKVA